MARRLKDKLLLLLLPPLSISVGVVTGLQSNVMQPSSDLAISLHAMMQLKCLRLSDGRIVSSMRNSIMIMHGLPSMEIPVAIIVSA